MKFGIVISKKDKAGMNIAKHLDKFGINYVVVEEQTIYEDDVDEREDYRNEAADANYDADMDNADADEYNNDARYDEEDADEYDDAGDAFDDDIDEGAYDDEDEPEDEEW